MPHKPRLLSNNGSSYIAKDLADYLGGKQMGHTRGAPNHPQTKGEIKRQAIQHRRLTHLGLAA